MMIEFIDEAGGVIILNSLHVSCYRLEHADDEWWLTFFCGQDDDEGCLTDCTSREAAVQKMNKLEIAFKNNDNYVRLS